MSWLIDPVEQGVFVYIADKVVTFYEQPESVLPVPQFAQKLEITVEQLFSWLSD